MARFDAELYLRERGEELLLRPDRQNRGWGMPLGEPAAALVAVGALSAARARSVLADYGFAEALRNEHGIEHRMHFAPHVARRSQKVRPLQPRRVIPCDREFETPGGRMHIHRVSLAADETSVAITWWPPASPRSGARHFGGMHSPPQATLTDDRGTQLSAGFSGGGGEVWTGQLQAGGALATDTAWIEIDGERIELHGEPWPSEVAIESLPDQPPALRHLWHELECSEQWHGDRESRREDAIVALLAAGVLARDDPELDLIRAVAGVMPHHPGMPVQGPSARLPEPWKSAFARRARTDGPQLSLALDAVTPVFEGFSAAVWSFDAEREHFEFDVDVAPGLGGHPHFSNSLDAPRLAWWAADDRGNSYLGGFNGWHGGPDRMTGTLHFAGALHPKAKTVRIMPTALRTRAVITIPLPAGS